MPRAIIVVGNELRFLRAAETYVEYLTEIGVDPVRVVLAGYRDAKQIERDVSLQIISAIGSPLLLAYFGHGLSDGWAHAIESQIESVRFEYARLVPMLVRRLAPTMIVNECCYAAGIIPHLEAAGADPKLISLIAACPADRASYPGMAKRVLESWVDGNIHEPVMEITSNSFKSTWRVRLRMWWYRRKLGLKARFFPRRHPIPPPPPPPSPICEVRWGAPLDHYFFPKP